MKYAPSSLAKTTSGTVVILITSAFQERNMKLSARDENLGPSIVTTVPEIIEKISITGFFWPPKGQLISKAIYGLLTSPKKRTGEFVLFAFLFFTANKSNSSVRFFLRIWGAPICFSVLPDLPNMLRSPRSLDESSSEGWRIFQLQ